MRLKREISIAGHRVADDEPVYIIGEMACGHQGDISQAKALVDAAVNAGADCIQLQIFETAANMAPSSPLYSVLERLHFSSDKWREIMSYARGFDIHVSIFAYDEPSLELALALQPDMIKLNSSELSNPAMLIGAAQCGLPFTVGTGASTLEEIRCAVEIVLKNGGENMILMHGVQNFPTPIEAANIRKIRKLKDEFGCLVIFADHTGADSEMSRWIDLAAIGQGAALLEKHLILDRSKEGVDWQAALEPNEFQSYVSAMRAGSAAMGPYGFQPLNEGERKYRRFQKKSLVAARAIEEGHIITDDDVKFLRVQGEREGIAPIDFPTVVQGRRAGRALAHYEQILPEDLKF
jgi:sialic acid synthase SpsE